MLSLLSLYTRALSFPTKTVSIDYCVLSFNDYKLTLQKTIVNSSLFLKNKPIQYILNDCQL